jgi:hypothetical protein
MKTKSNLMKPLVWLCCIGFCMLPLVSCNDDALFEQPAPIVTTANEAASSDQSQRSASDPSVLLVIDEESIDNGNPPNSFSETDVNDQLARVGLRDPLQYFEENVGNTIELYTGEVGDEGWHALKHIPTSWINAGPTGNGARNFLQAGPGLGGGEDDTEVLLDKIPNVTPLRAKGLKMLIGQTILAVVYDGDVSTNYGPLNGNLQGANLGTVALEVTGVRRRIDGSSGSLPIVTVRIVSVNEATAAQLKLFSNAPTPRSSSEPFDINPPATAPAIVLTDAR